MLRTIGWISWMFVYMLTRVPATWHAKRLAKAGQNEEATAIVSREVSAWASKLLRNIKITVNIQGTENLPHDGRPVVYAANHQSYLDIPILLSHISPPPAIMAKKELGKIPILGFWIKQLGCVLVERSDAHSGMEAIRQSKMVLDCGNCFAIFPEGTRSKCDSMGDFQAGAVHIAVKSGVAIVPILIDGSYRGYEGNGNRLKPAEVRIVILPGIETKELPRAEQKTLPGRLVNMLEEIQNC